MAVQKNKVSRRRRGNRRSHQKAKLATTSIHQISAERHIRHNMTPDGFFKDRLVVDRSKTKEETEEDQS